MTVIDDKTRSALVRAIVAQQWRVAIVLWEHEAVVQGLDADESCLKPEEKTEAILKDLYRKAMEGMRREYFAHRFAKMQCAQDFVRDLSNV